jgi:hypothetical protein
MVHKPAVRQPIGGGSTQLRNHPNAIRKLLESGNEPPFPPIAQKPTEMNVFSEMTAPAMFRVIRSAAVSAAVVAPSRRYCADLRIRDDLNLHRLLDARAIRLLGNHGYAVIAGRHIDMVVHHLHIGCTGLMLSPVLHAVYPDLKPADTDRTFGHGGDTERRGSDLSVGRDTEVQRAI